MKRIVSSGMVLMLASLLLPETETKTKMHYRPNNAGTRSVPVMYGVLGSVYDVTILTQ